VSGLLFLVGVEYTLKNLAILFHPLWHRAGPNPEFGRLRGESILYTQIFQMYTIAVPQFQYKKSPFGDLFAFTDFLKDYRFLA
jgi:hypothetical protein